MVDVLATLSVFHRTHHLDFLQVMTALASGADLPENVIIDKAGFFFLMMIMIIFEG